MKTKDEILSELIQIEKNKNSLIKDLANINKSERDKLFDTYTYIIGKCFKN